MPDVGRGRELSNWHVSFWRLHLPVPLHHVSLSLYHSLLAVTLRREQSIYRKTRSSKKCLWRYFWFIAEILAQMLLFPWKQDNGFLSLVHWFTECIYWVSLYTSHEIHALLLARKPPSLQAQTPPQTIQHAPWVFVHWETNKEKILTCHLAARLKTSSN